MTDDHDKLLTDDFLDDTIPVQWLYLTWQHRGKLFSAYFGFEKSRLSLIPASLGENISWGRWWSTSDAQRSGTGINCNEQVDIIIGMNEYIWRHSLCPYQPIRIVLIFGKCGIRLHCAVTTSPKHFSTVLSSLVQSWPFRSSTFRH